MRFARNAPSGTYYLVVLDVVNNVVFDWNTNVWVALGSAVTPGVPMTAQTIGNRTRYWADINLATLATNTTPRDVCVTMYRQAGGSPAPSTDIPFAWGSARLCCGYDVPADPASCPFDVDVTGNLTTTNGVSMHLTAELTFNGKTIPLATLDPTATCSFAVTQDAVTTGGARVAQFTIATGTVGAANSSSRFEAEYANPNLTSNRGFTVVATIVTGGVTYIGQQKFTTF